MGLLFTHPAFSDGEMRVPTWKTVFPKFYHSYVAAKDGTAMTNHDLNSDLQKTFETNKA